MTDLHLRLCPLGLPMTVRLVGVPDQHAGSLVRAWSRCGARMVDGPLPADVLLTAGAGWSTALLGLDVTSGGLDELDARLTSRLTLEAIERRAADLVLLHAAAVAHPESGATVALVGPSGRGKTTAARALSRSFGYVTDETVGVGDDLAVAPYPKPLSIAERGRAWKRQAGPDELGLRPLGPVAPRLHAVVLLDRVEGARIPPEVTVEPLHRAIGELAPQISHFPRRPHALRRLAALVEATGGVRRVRYSSAADLGPVIGGLMAEGPPPVADLSDGALADAVPPRHAVPAPGGRLRFVQGSGVEGIDDGARTITATGATIAVLDGIAPTIWRACSTPRTSRELVERVVREHGEPPGGSAPEAVRRVIADLTERRLLVPVTPPAGAGSR